ncbi:hypothetical protein CMEL01_08760 [Colletotrichum melonis]|uniref:Uncharacterized protein n=1 Tax=Colletotrichum melonis TaxID=1209925 RepID=A0AAI9XHS0_9PEZI|nr:hypothetical protein CMEL01_08760 [Colletotrichum melonis]
MDRSLDQWDEISPLLRFLVVIGVVETLATIFYFCVTLWCLARHKRTIDDENVGSIATPIPPITALIHSLREDEPTPLARVVLVPERRGGPKQDPWEPANLSPAPSLAPAAPFLEITRSVLTAGGITAVGIHGMDGALMKDRLSSLNRQAY